MPKSPRAWGIIIGILVLLIAGIVVSPVALPPIVLPAEVLWNIGGFPLTNTMVAGWITILFWAIFGWLATRNMQLIPSGAQNFLEASIEFLLNTAEQVAGKENGRRFFPIVGTIFLFIITSNWFGLFPGFGTIGLAKEPHGHSIAMRQVGPIAVVPLFERPPAADDHAAPADSHGAAEDSHAAAPAGYVAKELIPLFRSVNSDLNATLILGLVAFIAIETWGIRSLGAGAYLGKFISFKSPIDFFLGLIELVTEFARIISFAFRLFGNVFAGEVLLLVIGFLLPWVAVLPFYFLELFVGFIQAAVFAMLVLVFGSLAVTHHGPEEHGAHGEPAAAHH